MGLGVITKRLESVKLDSYWVDKVRDYKKESRVSIAGFIEDAIKEKLEGIEGENKLRKNFGG